MSRTSATPTKAVVFIGGQEYLLPLDKATKLVTLMAGAIAVEQDYERHETHNV